MKTKKIVAICIIALSTMSKGFSQVDFRPTNASTFSTTNAVSVVTKSPFFPFYFGLVRVYVDLETANTQSNPIAQFSYVINGLSILPHMQTFNPSTLSYRPGFSVSNVTRMVIKVDPKNEIAETNENNNVRTVPAN
jgi:hypothetical protein